MVRGNGIGAHDGAVIQTTECPPCADRDFAVIGWDDHEGRDWGSHGALCAECFDRICAQGAHAAPCYEDGPDECIADFVEL